MNCKQAQTNIALWVGGDLSENDVALLERHVAICPGCREHHLRMEHVQQMLNVSNSPPSLEESIWPDLEVKIERHQKAFRREQFNGWVPAFAVAAACLLLLFYSRTISNFQQPEQPATFNTAPFSSSNSFNFAPVNSPVFTDTSTTESFSSVIDFNSPRYDYEAKRAATRPPAAVEMPFAEESPLWQHLQRSAATNQ